MTIDAPAALSDRPLPGGDPAPAPESARRPRSARVDRAGAQPPVAALRQLMHLRSIAIVGQAAAIATGLALGVALRAGPMAVIVGALAIFNLTVSARLRRGTPTTHREVATHLALDLAAFGGLLLLAGGTENPFAHLYLLHVVLIAMLLPPMLAVAGTLLVIASFALAFRFAEPLRYADGQTLPHALVAAGTWLGFALTAAVMAWFLLRLVGTLREHDRLLQEAAWRALNDEAVLRIGTLAAGAAHELGTPLTTMAVVVGEMRRAADTPERQRDAAILSEQIDACRHALSNLRAAAGHARADGGGREKLDAFVESIVARFQASRPDVPLEARWDGVAPAPEILADESLRQAILILLNNAADASPHHVDMQARWDRESLCVTVGDRGAGVPSGALDKLGRTFFTTKPPGRGTGLGLVLTSSTVGRLGGTVRWSNRAGGGLVAEIRLPLHRLLLTSPTP